MKRLYFLIPDLDNATQISGALQDIGVAEEGVRIIVKDHDKLQMTQLLEAGIVEKTDLLGALVKGGIAGGVAGLLTGIALVSYPPEEFVMGGGTILAFTLFGILFGAWSSSMIGISIPNPIVERLERAVEAGGIMMLVDIPKEKENEVLDFMHTYHPETTIHGMHIASK